MGESLEVNFQILISMGNEPSGCEADIWRMSRGSKTRGLLRGF